MGTGELRIRLGISREHVHDLVIRRDFPHSYADLAQGRLWLTEDIDAWIPGWKLGRHELRPVNAVTTRHRLMGAHEIRAHLEGISRQRFYQLSLRSDFPEPVALLLQGKIWLAEEIELWHHLRRETPAPLQASSIA